MIAVVASSLDPEARALVAAWSSADGALLSAEDLSCSGWAFNPRAPAEGTAVVGGQKVRTRELRAVLTRRPAIVAEELGRIDPSDRSYVAAETNAFLVAWLSALPCPVVNRPTPTSLCGPAWDRMHWKAAAARAGVPWREPALDEETESVVVCGGQVLFACSVVVATRARALAREAGVTLLGVRAQRGSVCAASIAPNLSHPELRAALLHELLRRA